MKRSTLYIVLTTVVAGAILRGAFAFGTPSDLDELHYVNDALWSHPAFPADRVEFLRGHPSPHTVLSMRSWELITHASPGAAQHGWGSVRVGHGAAQSVVLGLLLRPFMNARASSPGEESRRLLVPARLLTALFDLGILVIVVLVSADRWGRWGACGAGTLYAVAPWVAGPGGTVRLDSMMTLALIGAILLLRSSRKESYRSRRVWMAGALLGLSVAVKQSAVLFFPALLLGLIGGRWLRRMVVATAVALVVALMLCDLGGTLMWANHPTADTGIPPDLLRNLLGLLIPDSWWMLGDSFAVQVQTPMAPLHRVITPPLLGALSGAVLLGILGKRRREALILLGLAILPTVLLPHGTAVYRLLPVAWVVALLAGVGVASAARAPRAHRVLACVLAVLVWIAFAVSFAASATYAEHYRAATVAYTDYYTAPEPRPAELLVKAQEQLALALEQEPAAAPALLLKAKVAMQEGRQGEVERLVVSACEDVWIRAYSPMFLPQITSELLRTVDADRLRWTPSGFRR